MTDSTALPPVPADLWDQHQADQAKQFTDYVGQTLSSLRAPIPKAPAPQPAAQPTPSQPAPDAFTQHVGSVLATLGQSAPAAPQPQPTPAMNDFTQHVGSVLATLGQGASIAPQAAPQTRPDTQTIPGSDTASSPLASQARQIAQQQGLDPDVFDRLVQNESGYDPGARSPVGAIGLTQLMPDTAKGLGVDPTDPTQNLTGGARYLKSLVDYYKGDYSKAIAAYNTGAGNVDRGNIPSETTAYVARVLGQRGVQGVSTASAAPVDTGRNASAGPVVSPGAGNSKLATALSVINQQIGKPYVWGGEDANGFDCSGLVQYAYSKAGIDLPRTAQQQFDATQRIAAKDLQAGDLVFFSGTDPDHPDEVISHVGVYAGGGQFLDASGGHSNGVTAGVQTDDLSNAFWQAHIAGYGRVPGIPSIPNPSSPANVLPAARPASTSAGVDAGVANLPINTAVRTPQPTYRAPFSDQQQPVQSTVTQPTDIAPFSDQQQPVPSTVTRPANAFTTAPVEATTSSPVDRALATVGQAAQGVGNEAAQLPGQAATAIDQAAQTVGPIAAAYGRVDPLLAPVRLVGAAATGGPSGAMAEITQTLSQLGAPANLVRAMIASPAFDPNNPRNPLVDAYNQADPSLPVDQRVIQALSIAAQPFQAGGLQAANDPTGGILAGLSSFIRNTVTDPTMLAGAGEMGSAVKAMGIGAGVGGIGAGIASRLSGATPEQTATNTATGAGIGTMAGPVAEAVGNALTPGAIALAKQLGRTADRTWQVQYSHFLNATAMSDADIWAMVNEADHGNPKPLQDVVSGQLVGGGGVPPDYTRMYHGTGAAYETPDAAKFDPNGLFGPGYYLTDDPRVAASYSTARSPTSAGFYATNGEYLGANASEVQDAITNVQQQLNRGGASNPDFAAYARDYIAKRQDALQLGPGQPSGPNVRAMDVPNGLNLLNADQPIGVADLRRVQAAAKEQGITSLGYPFYSVTAKSTGEALHGQLQSAIVQDLKLSNADANAKVNEILASVGYDGIQYNGGQRIPLADENGQPIQHTAVVLFPDAMPKVLGAYTGAPITDIRTTLANDPRAAMRDPLTGAGGGGGVAPLPAPPIDPTDALQANGRWARLQVLARQANVPLDFHTEMLDEELKDIPYPVGSPEYQAAAAPLISSYTRGVYQDVARDVGQRFTSAQAQLAGLQATLDPDLVAIAKTIRPVTADLTTMTADNYTRLTGITPSESSIVTVDGKRYVDPNYTFDELAQSHGYNGATDFQRAIEQTKQQAGQVAALKTQLSDLRSVNNGLKEFGASYAGNGAPPAASASSTVDLSNADRTPGIGIPRDLGVPGPTPEAGAAGAPVAGQQAPLLPRQPAPPPAPLPAPSGAGLNNPTIQTQINMFTRGPLVPSQTVAERLATARVDLVRALTDNKVDLANFQTKASAAVGRPLNADEMMYELSRLNPDMAAQVNVQNNLAPALQSVGKDRTLLSTYLTNQSNVDVSAALNNPGRIYSGGVTAADSAQALADLQAAVGPQRFAVIQKAADQVTAFNRALLQRKVDAGIISPALQADLVAKYPNYVPAKIVDYMDNPINVGRGQPISVTDRGLKALSDEGTSAAREDPLASTVRSAYQTEALVRRNDAFNAFTKLRSMDPSLQEAAKILSDDPSIPASQRVAPDYHPKADEVLVHGFVNGVRQDYVLPKEMGMILDAVQTAQGPVMAALAQAMGVIRGVLASNNPLFVPTHAMITAVPYVMRESTRAGGPENLPKIIGALVQSYGDALQGLEQGRFTGAATQRYLLGGGGQFGAFNPSLTGAKATVESLARPSPLTIQSAADIRRIVGNILTGKPVGELINRVDLAPRVAAMQLAEGRGENAVQAVTRGRTTTTDFQQGGNVAKALNQLIPFFNVAMQGAAQPARMFRDNPVAAIKTAIALLAAPTVGIEAWNRSDPQRAKDYEDVPDYVKNNGIVVMLPGQAPLDSAGNRRPQYISIPMREFAPFVSMTREAAARVMGAQPSDWGELLTSAATGSFPIPLESPGSALARVVPGGPLLTTPYNLIENKDLSTGASVDSKAKDASASALGQGVSSITQDAVSPAQADYAVRNLGGGPGQIAQAVSNTLSGQGSYQAGTPQGLPIVGPLVSRFVGSSTGQGLQDARRQNDQLQKALVAAGMPREVGISPVGPTANTVQLTTAEETRYQQLTNQLIEQIVREQLADKDFATRPRDEQVKIMQRAISVARKSATGQMLDQIGNDEIDRREAAATAAKARQMGSAPAVPAYAGPTVGPTPTPPWNIPAYRGPAATPTP